MKRELMESLVWAGIVATLALGSSLAYRLGYLEHDTVLRIVVGINGLWMVWYGNRVPKTMVPHAGARRARRVAGWSMVLSGFAYAVLFAVAPLPLASTAGAGAVLAGIAVTLGYCFSLRGKGRAA
jgi:hypothetical protein